MQSYYIKNTNGQSYCVYLEYRDFKTKNIVQLEVKVIHRKNTSKR